MCWCWRRASSSCYPPLSPVSLLRLFSPVFHRLPLVRRRRRRRLPPPPPPSPPPRPCGQSRGYPKRLFLLAIRDHPASVVCSGMLSSLLFLPSSFILSLSFFLSFLPSTARSHSPPTPKVRSLRKKADRGHPRGRLKLPLRRVFWAARGGGQKMLSKKKKILFPPLSTSRPAAERRRKERRKNGRSEEESN